MFKENVVFSNVEKVLRIKENISILIGKINESYLFKYLTDADNDFYEPLSDRVDLNIFSKKLHELSTTFVIVYKENVAGLIASYFYDKPSLKGFITLVHIKQSFRGIHLSDFLVESVKSYANSISFKYIDLMVYKNNVSAYNLYIKHGFTVIEEKNGRCHMRWNSVLNTFNH